MEYRTLGRSGLLVSTLALGTGSFSGKNGGAWGSVDVAEARRMIDLSLDAGINLVDCADIYGGGAAEEILGQAIKGKREKLLISTKLAHPCGDNVNDIGTSRYHIARGVEKALKKLGTDHIDLLQLHGFDAKTPPEETLATLDALIRAGKLGYVGVSNYAGWQLMKALAVADRYGLPRYVAHQAYYSLVGRDYEWELMPLGLDQGVGAVVYSPLGWGRLTGRIRRGSTMPADSRLQDPAQFVYGPTMDDEYLYRVVDALDAVALETGKTVPQVALNWVMGRPTIATVLIGARNEKQLQDNLSAAGWKLSADQIARLDKASYLRPSYPAWHQYSTPFLSPPAI
jgi:aryl-alcohol dehydrogenase-like predicted oxidoreductase